jgi:outer membrane protein assembly factor BamB
MHAALNTIWTRKLSESVSDDIFGVAISDDGQTLVAACGRSFHVLDADGRLLWRRETNASCLNVAVSPDGELIAASSMDDRAYLYDRAGRKIWELPVKSYACAVSLAGDEPCVAAALTDGKAVQFLPAVGTRVRWRTPLSGALSIATSADGSVTAVGTNDGGIYILDAVGDLKRCIQAGEGELYGLAMDAKGTYLAALDFDEGRLFFYQTDGRLLWSQTLEREALRVAMTKDGEVVACASAYCLHLIGRDGKELYRQESDEKIYAVALSPDGSRLVVGGEGSKLRLYDNFRNTLTADSHDAASAARALISQIRIRYLENPHIGLCRWLDEFDRSLQRESFVISDALLEELDAGGYDMDETERKYVVSRRGALWLGRGLKLHREQELEEARACYEHALAVGKAVGNIEGEGQARALLMTLEQDGGGLGSEDLLEGFRSRMKVLGSGEALMTYRVTRLSPGERLGVIRAAKEVGYLEPLLTALDDPREEHGRAAAAAALVYLKPGAEEHVLLSGLKHPNWFVRWRVAECLNRMWESQTPSQGSLNAVTAALVSERDPDVRRELVEIVGKCGGAQHTRLLIFCLGDQDDNVKFAVCQALGRVGDRRALASLNSTQGGQDISGGHVFDAASSAVSEIEQRDPPPAVREVVFYTSPAGAGSVPPRARLFLPSASAVYGLIRLEYVPPNLRASVRQETEDASEFVLNIHTNPGRTASGPAHFPASEPEGGGFESDFELVELLPEQGAADVVAEGVSLKLKRPSSGWLGGLHQLVIYVDGEFIAREDFEVVEAVPIERCILSSAITSEGKPAAVSHVFMRGTPTVFCHAKMETAPSRMRVSGRVSDSNGRLVADYETGTATEGAQEVLLYWNVGGFGTGKYTAVVENEAQATASQDFLIIDEVQFIGARMCLQADGMAETAETVSVYRPDDDFVLHVGVTATPPYYNVSAEWFWKNHRISDERSMVMMQESGEHTVTFMLRKPEEGWSRGKYSVVIRGDYAQPVRLSFSVRPVPPAERLRRLAANAWAFVLRQVKSGR